MSYINIRSDGIQEVAKDIPWGKCIRLRDSRSKHLLSLMQCSSLRSDKGPNGEDILVSDNVDVCHPSGNVFYCGDPKFDQMLQHILKEGKLEDIER